MNLPERYNAYTPVVTREGIPIERDDFTESQIWAKTHIVAIVAIVALTYMVDSNNKRDIEIAREQKKVAAEKQREVFNFRKFVGVDK